MVTQAVLAWDSPIALTIAIKGLFTPVIDARNTQGHGI
jgi:hypothetical protein